MNKKNGPFIESKLSTARMMIWYSIFLLLITLFLFYKNGIIPYLNKETDLVGLFTPLIFVIIPMFISFFLEELYQIFILKRKSKTKIIYDIKNNYGMIPGWIVGLLLPYNTPVYLLVLGSAMATLFGKILFGGFGNYKFNPGLVGVLVVVALFGNAINDMGGYSNISELSKGLTTPLSNMNTVGNFSNYSELVKPYGSFLDFLLGLTPGELCPLLCLLGLIVLGFKKVIKWRIPLYFIGVMFISTFILGLINNQGIWYPTFHILSGNLLFLSIFIATDPITSPVTHLGQRIYGILLALLTLVFRFIYFYPESVMLSILTLNIITPILDIISIKLHEKVITSNKI